MTRSLLARLARLSSVCLLAGVLSTPALTSTAQAAAPSPTRTTVNGVDVDAATIPQLQRLMDRGRLSSQDLVRFYTQRIARLNPRLNAVITVNRSVLAQARVADRLRRHGDDRPMLGIPVMVKDNVNTTGMPTTAGSLALKGSTPPDAFIVRRLKAQGALIIGKANLSEWANYRGFDSSSGWSAVGGQTNLAYALDRNPCGSSSGSAVAASADLATVAIGTETDGSIVCPSGQNGVVGLKPTLGLASRTGIVPISAEQDTAGPITRNVTDAAVVLGALTGVDPRDEATRAQRGHVRRDYTRALSRHALRGARIGVWREGTFGSSPATDAIMERTITRLRGLGATIVDPADIAIAPAYDGENTALQHEFKHDIEHYLRTWTAPQYPKTLADLIAFNEANRATELRFFGQEIFLAAQATTGGLTNPAYVQARQDATRIARQAIRSTLREHDLDAVVAPTNSPAWKTDLENGDDFLVSSSSPSAISGFPDVTVPAGYSAGLPVGVSFIGTRWGEPKLLSLAYAWEQATRVRRPPQFLASVPTP